MPTSDEIDLAPFPPLAWVDPFWEGFAPRPPVWRKLRVESERRLRGGETDHAVTVYRAEHVEPSREQCEAYRSFLDGGAELVGLVLRAVHANYSARRPEWLKADRNLELPEIATAEELVSMTSLCTVYVHDVLKDGIAYVGVALRCAWDREHGAGVMLHGTRVVSVGGHDDAMLPWIATRDAEGRTRKTPAKKTSKKAPNKTNKKASKKNTN